MLEVENYRRVEPDSNIESGMIGSTLQYKEVVDRVLLLFSFKNDTILDPFAGAGTTCVSAKKNQRQFLDIDVTKKYCATAEQRLNFNI